MNPGTPPSPLSPPQLPSLLSLLSNTTPQTRKSIASCWGSPVHDPKSLEHVLIHNHDEIRQRLEEHSFSPAATHLLIDMVQDFGYPILLDHNDAKARKELAFWGLIYPAPHSPDVPKSAHNAWVLPTEVAILYAPTLPIHRPRLQLLLGNLSEERRNTIAQTLHIAPNPNPILLTCAIARALLDPERLRSTLSNPDFFEHLFTLQLLYEWQGLCYEQELFSFAWGNSTLIPFTQRNHQNRERSIQSALFDRGLLYSLPVPLPPPEDPDTQPQAHNEDEDEETTTMNLMVLPEELRGAVWDINREHSEDLLHDTINTLGGWAQRPTTRTTLPHEPVDRLKAFACVLTNTPPPFVKNTLFPPPYIASLDHLEASITEPIPSWSSLLAMGDVVGLFNAPKGRRLRKPKPTTLSAEASHILDPGPQSWSRTVLNAWVQGRSTHTLDSAQLNAFGTSQLWLNAIQPTLSSLFQNIPPLETWWLWLHNPTHIPQHTPNTTFKRPIPSWLYAKGFDDTDSSKIPESGCGTPPRPDETRDELWQQALIAETAITCFRLLTLDLLAGLNPQHPIPIQTLSTLLQDTASLCVHLTLAFFVVDVDNQTYVPIHPPTLLIEPSQDDAFEHLTHTLIDHLFTVAGVAKRIDAQHIQLLPNRILVDTPPWFSKDARHYALRSLLDLDEDTVQRFFAQRHTPLRSVVRPLPSSHAKRIWLGHPLHTLRSLTKEHTVQSISDGYIDITPQRSTPQ